MSNESTNMIAHQDKIIILETRRMLLIREADPRVFVRAVSSKQFWHPRLVHENMKGPIDSPNVIKRFEQALACLDCSLFFLLNTIALLNVRHQNRDEGSLEKHLDGVKDNGCSSRDPKVFELWKFVRLRLIFHVKAHKLKACNEERNHPSKCGHHKNEPDFLNNTCLQNILNFFLVMLLFCSFVEQRLFQLRFITHNYSIRNWI